MLTNITTIKDLFSKWQQERPGYRPFSNDGIIGDRAWCSASQKIAFILKECNDDFWDITGKLEYSPSGGNSRLFWRNLNIWKYTVTSTLDGEVPSFEQAMALREDPVTGIAYVNLKKNAEFRNPSYAPDISKYVEEDWPFLTRQIEIINPEVLFFCGTFKFVRAKMEFTNMGPRAFRVGARTAVDFFHPSCRKGYKETFTLLRDLLQCLKPSCEPSGSSGRRDDASIACPTPLARRA